MVANVHALTFPRSSKVAMVPSNISDEGGSLYVGSTWPDGGSFTFVNLSPTTIADGNVANPITAGGYDTIVFMANWFDGSSYPRFPTLWADTDFQSRILSFLNGGGKLIIYTSETDYGSDFSTFVIPFTVDTPGQTGSSGGTLTNLVNDTLSSTNPADAYPNGLGSYVNLALITSQTDAVGDLNVMTTYNSNWYIDLFGINVNNVGGPGHTYAFYGSGLIIFNGLDVDYTGGSAPTNANGAGALGILWWRELCGQTLGQGPNVNGLTVTPATATNVVNTQHTVTATVRNTQNNNPIANVVVTFTITSGPSTGVTGQATTNAQGQATFTWSSSAVGTDTVQASIPNSNVGQPAITSTATKDWILPPTNAVPEVPLGTISAISALIAAFAIFMARGKLHKQTPI